MDADQVAEMLSSVRLREEVTNLADEEEEEGEENADRSAVKMAEAEYNRVNQCLLNFLASAILATDGNMQSAIVAGALDALRSHLTSSFVSEHNDTPVMITPKPYENKVGLIKRYSRSSLKWKLIAQAPDAKIKCIIQKKNDLYHLGVYDSSLKPTASGYIIQNGFL